MSLHRYLDDAAPKRLDHVAVEEPGVGSVTYRELVELTDRLRDRLVHLGVEPGDRVGIYMKKSVDAVASLFGILKTGAAHVPVDPGAPASRNAYIHANCTVKAVIVEQRLEAAYREELAKLGHVPPMLVIDGTGAGKPLRDMLALEQEKAPAKVAETVHPEPDSLAYILYTSGSTGKPKGVMLTHRSAKAFVDWCSEIIEPRLEDRFSNHAPFHFDISVLDLYTPLKHGATLVLVAEDVGKEPVKLAKLIADTRISIWYSAPSILSLLAQYGNLPAYDYSNLRMVHFAGEVFPVVHLRALRKLWPAPRYFNLYGPTETNVCTYYELPPGPVPEDRTDPYPIGPACSHYEALVVDADGNEVEKGKEGELCMAGPGVMRGYYGQPEMTAKCFLPARPGEPEQRWYKTGDLVVELPAPEGFKYVGRRDRMVKKRGYRVELGEIEVCLYKHPDVREAAVIALSDEEGVKIRAHLSAREGKKLSIIAIKKFCSENLPNYMIPDVFKFHDDLPKTSTDKCDYQRLKAME
ncbi:amino acid adenylation domain-containing protein [Myxococcota bacterium]|nr:amino acid adenylation domain-containing protein [Myxococcota bacterium]